MAWIPLRMTVWVTLLLNVLTNNFILGQHPKTMEVKINQGILIGSLEKTWLSNKPFYKFLGVPYAKAPIHELRFKPPVKPDFWFYKRQSFSEGSKCMQVNTYYDIEGSEDCLYLNIFVPYVVEHNKNRAVMVYIHPGAFMVGSGSEEEYAPDYLLDENVIVVTLNFRLNVFGFLNLDIEDCSGNMGLKDQLFAIKWVKENISNFGGNPINITIFGSSTGAASVHGHILSPLSSGLFQKAIMQSGNMFNSWALNVNHYFAASKVAKYFDCRKNNPEKTLKCLKRVSAKDFMKFIFLKGINQFLEFEFIPSIESYAIKNRFFPSNLKTLRDSAIPVPIITGLNNMEGLLGLDEDRINELGNIPSQNFIHKILKGSFTEKDVTKIMTFYFNQHNLQSEKTKWENIVNLQSDMYYVKDFHRGFEHLLKENVTTSVYIYEFKFDGKLNAGRTLMSGYIPSDKKAVYLKGACHGDELSYLFYSKLFGPLPEPNSPELRMCKTLSKLWSNFAKNGDPNSPDLLFKWEKTSFNEPKYLSIDTNNTKMVDGLLYGSRVDLWKDMLDAVRK